MKNTTQSHSIVPSQLPLTDSLGANSSNLLASTGETMFMEIEPIPLKPFHLGDMLTGLSSNSIAVLLETARQDKSATRHLVIQGDASDAVHLLPNQSVDLAITSLPYETLVDYKNGAAVELNGVELGSEENADDHVRRLIELFKALFAKLKPDGSLVINVGNPRVGGRGEPGPNGIRSKSRRKGMRWGNRKGKSLIRLTDKVADAAETAGFLLRHVEIWRKPYNKPDKVKDRSRQVHEYVLVFQRSAASKCDRRKLTAAGIPNDTSVFTCPVSQANYGHPATFNPLLPERYVLSMSEPGDVVLDIMGGVGSTAMAAMKNGRHSVIIELYPQYCNMAKNRLLHFSKAFKATVYEPAPFDPFDPSPNHECSPLAEDTDFIPQASDVRYMYNYRAVPRPELLKDVLPAQDPQPLDPFPVECLPDFQRKLLDDLVLASEADEAVAATCIITTWSAAIAGAWEAFDRKKSVVDYPNLQSVVVMPSGAGKSVALKIAKPLGYFNRLLARMARLHEWEKVPTLTSDCVTGPALIEQLSESNNTTFLFSPEAGGLLADIIAGGKGGGGNIFDLLLKGFSVEPSSYRTKKDGPYNFTPNIAMLLLAQPDLVKEIFSNKQFKARGLGNRWLILETPATPHPYDDGRIFDSDPRKHQLWHARIRDALYMRLLGKIHARRHTWTDGAIEVFRARHNLIVDRIAKDWQPFEGLLRRSRELQKRITLGLLAAEYYSGNSNVLEYDEDVALRASVIMDWFDRQRIGFFSTSYRETMKARKLRVLGILWELEDHTLTLRDMKRRHGLEESELKELASAYPKVFEIKSIKPAKAGRPARVICLRWMP